MKLWALLQGLAGLLAGCRAIYVAPMMVGAFEGSLNSQSTGEVPISVYQMSEPSTQFCQGAPFASGVLNKVP